MKRRIVPVTVVLLVCLVGGCASLNKAGPVDGSTVKLARAHVTPTRGHQVEGLFTFQVVRAGVRISGSVHNLSRGPHGIHIHETGDCSAPDASSAGGHYNPTGAPHGHPDDPPEQRHLGDLGNIHANPDRVGTYERVDRVIRLNGPHSILGKALIIHAGEDDLRSQPTGNAGLRLACGVIEPSREEQERQ